MRRRAREFTGTTGKAFRQNGKKSVFILPYKKVAAIESVQGKAADSFLFPCLERGSLDFVRSSAENMYRQG
jgi:hypothetical protein